MNAPRLLSPPKATIATYLLLLINCLSPMAAIVVAPSLPQMQAHFANVPNVEFLVPISLTIPGLLVALLSPGVGILADRLGRKRLLICAMAGYGILGVLPLFLDSLYAIIASRVGLGCVEAVVVTISTTLIGDYYSGALRQKYLALQTTFASCSAILFFMIGGALGELGWRMPYIVYLVSLLLVVLGHYLLWEPRRDNLARDEEESSSGPRVFRPGLLAMICMITFIGAVAFMVLQIQMAYLLDTVGENSPQTAGMIASACSVMIVLGTLSVHLLFRLKLRIPHCLALSFGLIGFSFFMIPFAHNWQGMLAASLVNGLGCGLMLPTLAIWNMRELPWQRRGMGTGMWYGSYCLGMFFSPILVVAVSKHTGGVVATVGLGGWVLLPLAAVALGCALASRRSHKMPIVTRNLEKA
ncbi:MFS transporter [Pseudomonas sp. LTJR-52]|uniref:MFS transporter n=1 Tax=Pseudomonas sp. LTJR-52 TaxID=2479392 RepID=UPI000EFCC092|nr:MFS transporter [Pseudomonas sp. LTJR-52]AYN97009.1 MFS transporter [Pseudomonas sp. LTJR-52]